MEPIHETGPRAAVDRFALALDGMLVNGATMCLSPLQSARDFIEAQLHARAAAELSHLRQCIGLTEEEQMAFADRLLSLKDALLALVAHQAIPKEQRDARIRHLRAVYVRAQDHVKQLEHRLGLTSSFYERPDGPQGERVAAFVARLPELFDREQTGPIVSQGSAAVGCGPQSPRVTDEPLSRQ